MKPAKRDGSVYALITWSGSNPNTIVTVSRKSAEGRRVPLRMRLTIDSEQPTNNAKSRFVN